MKNIIEEMYNGNLFPLGTYAHASAEYNRVMEEIIATEKILLQTHPKVKELFDKYQNAQIQLKAITNSTEFINGVRVGAQMILEMIKPIE